MDIVDPFAGTRPSASPSPTSTRNVRLMVLDEGLSDGASRDGACDSSREAVAEDDEPPSRSRLTLPPLSSNPAQSSTFGERMTARDAAAASRAEGFVQSERTRRFRARVFPDATDAQWNDWKWQLRMRIRDLETLERAFTLSKDERETVTHLGGQLPVGITPYYASLIDPEDADDPIRRTMVPTGGELIHTEQEAEDPLNEDGDMPVEGLVHRYPDRVLFLVTSFCATYCRYCTRSRLVGKTGEYHFNTKQFERALAYIEATPEIRDVLISGGDPLTMNDDKIDWLLTRLRAIPHVEFIRIGSKIPCVLPQRITPNLVSILQKCHPFWMSVHFMHPNEVTPEVAQSCGRLVNAGVPLGSQTVLHLPHRRRRRSRRAGRAARGRHRGAHLRLGHDPAGHPQHHRARRRALPHPVQRSRSHRPAAGAHRAGMITSDPRRSPRIRPTTASSLSRGTSSSRGARRPLSRRTWPAASRPMRWASAPKTSPIRRSTRIGSMWATSRSPARGA